ncbi:uncharacterized protein BJ212DRAFT_1299088 [Suillus subaureus]|uniref:Uncharacterized protein n=1 Tax=Suillus subaureus TaxID=48587 RepID=A0A9P7ECU2_9AGAM|nr:uncharacterized protein BJ212DRAFT_1299088 [Suillus subaureus]KAG1817535.1 hypothetical protein BJ212DRAFT_1299088 [Suillus subaureus]
MGVNEHQTLNTLRNDTALPPGFDKDADEYSFGDVCNGTDSLPISHAGGEFNDLTRDVLGDVWKMTVFVGCNNGSTIPTENKDGLPKFTINITMLSLLKKCYFKSCLWTILLPPHLFAKECYLAL